MELKNRSQYLDKLISVQDMEVIKVVTGIRRCGKSTILDMLRDDLLKSGIAADHILSMRYTSEDFDDGMTDKAMYQGIDDGTSAGTGRHGGTDPLDEL